MIDSNRVSGSRMLGPDILNNNYGAKSTVVI